MVRSTIAVLYASLIFTSAAIAQTGSRVDSTLGAIQRLYDNGMFVSSELEARRMLEDKTLSDSVRTTIERQIACSLVAQDKIPSAVDHFLSVLRYDPNFQFDRILTSPKILTAFDEAKSEFLSQKRRERDVEAGMNEPSRLSPSYRTLIFPGWEQLHQERTAVGYAFVSSGVLALGLTVAFDIQRRSAKNDYLSATSSETAQARYGPYNRYYRAETYSAIAFGIVYFASELEVFFNPQQSFMAIHAERTPLGGRLSVSIPL
ncbi:MAG TPA: hypothetical protein VI758_10300 [Bacteroidota bacterium]